MIYRLFFKVEAKKEWDQLDATVRKQFKKKLSERIENPRVESARLNGMKNCYKIKLNRVGYRLVYQVRDEQLIVSVVAVGKRERNQVYRIAVKRL